MNALYGPVKLFCEKYGHLESEVKDVNSEANGEFSLRIWDESVKSWFLVYIDRDGIIIKTNGIWADGTAR
jgi:hypothetical protein